MRLFLEQRCSLKFRLLFAGLAAVMLFIADLKLDAFSSARNILNSLVTPLQYIVSFPAQVADGAIKQFSARQTLIKKNQRLQQSLFLQQTELLLLAKLKKENKHIKALLGSIKQPASRKLVVEVMLVNFNYSSYQVMINEGAMAGVYEGQPVINEQGIVGQVVQVNKNTSRVLLIIDSNHAVPVQVARNEQRMVAQGIGKLNRLILTNIPSSADLKEGDLLLTSGLGQRFPAGYPVAYIKHLSNQASASYIKVEIEPIVAMDKLRYLLLLWPKSQ